MTRWIGPHGSLVVRAYLLIGIGLAVVAVCLDLGFQALQSRGQPANSPWLESTLALVEDRLAGVPPAERPAVLAHVSAAADVAMEWLPSNSIARRAPSDGPVDTLIDAEGRRVYLYTSRTLDGMIRIGPLPPAESSWLPRLLTPAFYLSIFIVVALWLRPLLRDIDHMTEAAGRFAADYREPLATAARTTRLTPLARSLDDMSARISGLIQNQKELIAALSHEMRTPLTRIRFALAVLDDKDRDARQQQIDALNQDVDEIDELIATMLSYARLDHPDLRMTWQAVPVTSWLADIAGRSAPGDAAIDIHGPPPPALVDMDPRLMELALRNMLGNARRYANRAIRVSLTQSEGRATLTVDDDGPGIPPAKREEAFLAFSRLDASRTRTTGGSGLGLAIVRRIASLHGGHARIEQSDRLGGARVAVCWPVAATKTAPVDAQPGPQNG